jgi:hypothetical protein
MMVLGCGGGVELLHGVFASVVAAVTLLAALTGAWIIITTGVKLVEHAAQRALVGSGSYTVSVELLNASCSSGFVEVAVRASLGGDYPRRLIVVYANGSTDVYEFEAGVARARLACGQHLGLLVESVRGWLYPYRPSGDMGSCLARSVFRAEELVGCLKRRSNPDNLASSVMLEAAKAALTRGLTPYIFMGRALRAPQDPTSIVHAGLLPGYNAVVDLEGWSSSGSLARSQTTYRVSTMDARQYSTVFYDYRVEPYRLGDNDTMFYLLRSYYVALTFSVNERSWFRVELQPPLLTIPKRSWNVSVSSGSVAVLYVPFLVTRWSGERSLLLTLYPLTYRLDVYAETGFFDDLGSRVHRPCESTLARLAVTDPPYVSVKLHIVDPLDYSAGDVVTENPVAMEGEWLLRAVRPLRTYTILPATKLSRPVELVVRLNPSTLFSSLSPSYDVVLAVVAVYAESWGARTYSLADIVEELGVDSCTTSTAQESWLVVVNGIDLLVAVYYDRLKADLSPEALYLGPSGLDVGELAYVNISLGVKASKTLYAWEWAGCAGICSGEYALAKINATTLPVQAEMSIVRGSASITYHVRSSYSSTIHTILIDPSTLVVDGTRARLDAVTIHSLPDVLGLYTIRGKEVLVLD